MPNWNSIFDQLSLSRENGLFITEDIVSWSGSFSRKIEQALIKLKPYAFFCLSGEPFILFFDEDRNNTETHHGCWNFNQAPVIFFNGELEIQIYNGFALAKHEKFLQKLGNDEEVLNFSYWNLASGKTWESHQKLFKRETRVDYRLLANISAARNLLLKSNLSPSNTNNIIGRMIFVRYLIDRKVRLSFTSSLLKKSKDGFLDCEDFNSIIQNKQELYRLFEYLSDKFKGDLFPVENDEEQLINSNHLYILYNLFNGNEIESGQISLFDIYDFSIIPVEFISNVYEYFMGADKQDSQKAFYTPTFLVNYILSHTVSNFFYKNPSVHTCRVLDPTCGSGIFLVEAFRRLVNQYERVIGRSLTNQDQAILRQLVSDNIYGIDKDKNAINVAMFSLYITILDFQDPKDIESFEFPPLKNKNFFVEDFFDFFDGNLFENSKENNYAVKLYDIDFNFIIGNPPWGTVKGSPYMEYIKRRSRREGITSPVSDKQFAQAFLIRTSDFCRSFTKCAIVTTSKVFYNNEASDFRDYIIKNFYLDKVFELSPVRDDVFAQNGRSKKAIGPAAVVFYRYAFGKPTSDNDVTHISLKRTIFYKLFKILSIEKNDVKQLKQHLFSQYPWIWKVLLYGNSLDFQFIKRLREYPTVLDIIGDKNRFDFGTGIMMGGGDENDATHLVGKPFLDTNKKQLIPFRLTIPQDSKWSLSIVHRPRRPILFDPPMLLVKKGLTAAFRATASLSLESIAFTDSVTSIIAFNDQDIKSLRVLEGLFNSKLFAYFLLCTGSSVGVEREQAYGKDEKFVFPYQFSESVANRVEELEELIAGFKEPINIYKLSNLDQLSIFRSVEEQKQITLLKKCLENLDEAIYDLYDLNNIERALVDYANEISIPLIGDDEYMFRPFSENNISELNAYNKVFNSHFSKIFDGSNGLYFAIETLYNQYYVANFFKVVTQMPEEKIKIRYSSNLDGFSQIASLSLSKESERLYTQKDIKGFENSDFYIIKPNEYKCWHRAVAYSDLFEIREALLKQALIQEA